MRVGQVLGALAGLALLAAPRWSAADEPAVHYTDQGWYEVQGPDTQPEERPGELLTMPAQPAPPATVSEPVMRSAEPVVETRAPACVEERGALARRLLSLRGLTVSEQDVPDQALGRLVPAPGTFTSLGQSWLPTTAWDPDVALLGGAVPLPLGAISFDWEAQALSAELLRCMTRD